VSRISKAVREEAIEALLCCADARVRRESTVIRSVASGRAQIVACSLRGAVNHATGYQLSPVDDYLEAAALLLDGWNPGDPVARR
jgi:hypothetical protein